MTRFEIINFLFQPIVSGTKIKNVTSFCLNENPLKSNPFSIEVGVFCKLYNINNI